MEKEEGVFIGVVSGILQDIYFTQAFGINALVKYVMLCSRHYRRRVYGKNLQNNSCYYYVFFNHYKAYSGIF